MNVRENILKHLLQFNIVIDMMNQFLSSTNAQTLDIKAELNIIKTKITNSISSDEINKAKLNMEEISAEQTPTSLNPSCAEINEVLRESLLLFKLIALLESLCDTVSIIDSSLNFECEFTAIKTKTIEFFLNCPFLPKGEQDKLKGKMLNNTLFC